MSERPTVEKDAPQHDTRARFCEVRLRVIPREWVPGVRCPACEATRVIPPEGAAMNDSERAAVVAILNEMRENGAGATLFYAEKLAQALGEPTVITPAVIASGRLSR